MKTVIRYTIIGVLVTVLPLVGQTVFASGKEKTSTSAEDVGQEAAETYRALKSYTLEQRDKALSAARERLSDLDRRIESLQERVDEGWQEMSESGRQQARKTLKALQRQRERVAEWYGGMRHSSAEAWDEVKKGFADSYDRLEQAFDRAKKDWRDDS